MSNLEVLKSLQKGTDLWTTLPKDARIADCRQFAKKHGLKLPKGVPQNKEAYVVMFKLCHFAPERLVSVNKTGLSQEVLSELYAYRNARDAERHAAGSPKAHQTIPKGDHASLPKKKSVKTHRPPQPLPRVHRVRVHAPQFGIRG